MDKPSPVLLTFNEHPEVQAAAEQTSMRGEKSQASQERTRPGTGHAESEEKLGKAEAAEAATGVGVWRDKERTVRTLIERTSGLERVMLRSASWSEPQVRRGHSQLRTLPNLASARAQSSEQL